MVEYVYEHGSIEAGIRIRDRNAVESPYRNLSLGPHKHVNAFNRGIGPLPKDEPVELSVPTADIENPSLRRDKRGKCTGQDLNSAANHRVFMQCSDKRRPAHAVTGALRNHQCRCRD